MAGVWTITCIVVFYGAAAASGRTVESIDVVVQSEDGGEIAPLIQKRMKASVQTIAWHILAGRSLDEIGVQKESDEKLIREVFDRILVGYTVQAVEIEVESAAVVRITVIPWPDIIQSIDLQIETEDLREDISQLVKSDIKDVRQVFEQVLIGLPIDASVWTGGIVKESLNEFLAVHLPEFRADYDIQVGAKTMIRLSLYPKGTVIRDVKVSLRSRSIPNLLLYDLRPAMQRQSEMLVGLPVGFAERHKEHFINLFNQRINLEKRLRVLGARSKIDLRVGTSTELMVESDTDKYNIFVEGYLDVGREEDNTSFRLHTGKYISPLDEVYLEADFFPHRVKWVLMPGLSRKLTPQTTVGYKYDLDEKAGILWGKQVLDDRWLLRFEHTPRLEENEFAIRYRIHDFVELEYMFSDKDNWLRLIGNF